jgi:hypothetical protein
MLPAGFHLVIMDALTETLQTLDQLPPQGEAVDDRVVEHFLLRTGRPLPRVIVIEPGFATLCRQVDSHGGDSLGIGGPNQLAQARAQYPGGSFLEADFRALALDRGAWDGAWVGRMVQHIPRNELVTALASLHAALRPGGLLRVTLLVGDEDGFRETDHGKLYCVRWTEAGFTAAIGALDFSLIERAVSDDEAALIFRREY